MRRVAFVAVLSLIAAACGGSSGGDTTTTPSTTSAATTTTATATTTTAAATTTTAAATTTTEASQFDTAVANFIADMGGVGDCFDTGYDTANFDFDYEGGATPVSCDGPHDQEVFYVGELDYAAGEPFPGQDNLIEHVFTDVCPEPFQARYGVSPGFALTLAMWAAWPLEEEWAAGMRTVKCSATNPFNDVDGTQLLGDGASAGLFLPMHVIAALANNDDDELDLYVYGYGQSLESLQATNLTMDGNAMAEQSNPSWMPDLSAIAYAAAAPGEQPDVFLIDGRTLIKTNLTNNPANDGGPSISPDGTKILFTSDRNSSDLDIFVMDIDGSNVTQLTFDEEKESSPDWSPDGSRIVYRKRVNGNDDIWVMNADGSGQRFMVGGPASEYDPDWSPDGSTIAFISDETGNFDIWTFPAEGIINVGAPPSLAGAFATQITDTPSDEEYPDWSPDGQYIVFASSRYGTPGIWVMRADGSDASDLLFEYPVWNPQVAMP